MAYSAWLPASRWLIAGLILNPDDGGDTFLQNNGTHMELLCAISQKMATV
jgi:hypothetical protein